MERLEITPSLLMPKIIFDKQKGIFSISGTSRPEHPTQFYAPVLEWMKNYLTNPNSKTVLEINIEYFNTSTSKVFLDLFELLEEAANRGIEVHVNWYYVPDDEEMMEAGEELLELVSLPYSLLEIRQN